MIKNYVPWSLFLCISHILSPVHLEDTYYVRKLELQADEGKYLTKDGTTYQVRVVIPEGELSEWYEVDK